MTGAYIITIVTIVLLLLLLLVISSKINSLSLRIDRIFRLLQQFDDLDNKNGPSLDTKNKIFDNNNLNENKGGEEE